MDFSVLTVSSTGTETLFISLAPIATFFDDVMSLLYRLFLMLGLLATSHSIFAQCSDWEKLFYYKSVSFGDAAHDRFGNVYVVGSFFEDGFTLGSNTFTLPVGQAGAFIAKFDKNNSLVWAISPTVGYRAFGKEVEIDPDDNVIVAGDFDTSISFGCLSFPGSGRSDIFVAKFMPDGTPLWITGSTGADDSSVEGISISPNGNCILISNFVERSNVTPGLAAPDVKMGGVPVITGAVDQISAGYDSFVASIEPDGTVAWTQGIGGDGNNYDYVSDVTTDSGNNIIITGYFNSDQISFDGHLVHSFMISENYYLAKINPQGQTQWVRETEGGINQSGWGVDTDADDNIFVAGRFYGDAKFGSFTLMGKGEADVFVVKLTPEGTTASAMSMGNDGFDAGTAVEVNSQGHVLISAYYYSNYLEIGTYSSSKSDLSADSFVTTLSNDLTIVECAKFITGDGESIVWNFELDSFDNAIVNVDLMIWEGHEVNFDSQSFTDEDYWSLIAVLGDNPATDEGEIPDTVFPQVSLGNDTTLCIAQKLILSVGTYCNAEYRWSTGSTDMWIEVITPGVYWVDLTWNGNTVRDNITVSYYEPISVALGNDRFVCPGEIVSWTLPVYADATYKWSDGESSNEKSLTTPGTYWVEVSNRCETVHETVTLELKPPTTVELGNDVVACNSVTLNYAPAPDETLRWSDGSTSPSLLVTQSGIYQLTVDNGCVEITDEVQVTIKKPGEFVVPNIVTSNSDGKNDHFLLPPDAERCSLGIYNRWGEKVFYAEEYQNNWPLENLGTGVYFYTLQGECMPALKGTIHLVH
jgi:hypothetical protein